MKRNPRNRKKPGIVYKILVVFLIVLIFYSSVILGMIFGNIIFKLDLRMIENIDVNPLKNILKYSYPAIDTVYNSGKISISLTSEINGMMKRLFDFDINKPITILNAYTPILDIYYGEEYNNNNNVTQNDSVAPEKEPGKNSTEKNNDMTEKTEHKYIERTSSITIEDEMEDRDYKKHEIIKQGEIKVINETEYEIGNSMIENLYNQPLDIDFSEKNGPKVLIFHTHTNEAYLRSIEQYDVDVPNRIDDPRYNVVRVGEELAQHLRRMGIEVLHCGVRHNYPADSGCYLRSGDTVVNYLEAYPSIKLVLDIHRDGMTENDPKLRVVTEIEGEETAKMMFVVGTGEIGLSHPNWKKNFSLALKLQNWLNVKYSDIMRPIYISKYRYNHHLSPGALIVEAGGDGNTLDEALNSTQYLAEAVKYIIDY